MPLALDPMGVGFVIDVYNISIEKFSMKNLNWERPYKKSVEASSRKKVFKRQYLEISQIATEGVSLHQKVLVQT
jgi:hypothetical protein